MRVQVEGLRVWDSGLRVWGFRVWDSGMRGLDYLEVDVHVQLAHAPPYDPLLPWA